MCISIDQQQQCAVLQLQEHIHTATCSSVVQTAVLIRSNGSELVVMHVDHSSTIRSSLISSDVSSAAALTSAIQLIQQGVQLLRVVLISCREFACRDTGTWPHLHTFALVVAAVVAVARRRCTM
jgi:hypothetical protein